MGRLGPLHLHSQTFMSDIRMGWSRGPIGYRDAQLESSDFTAAMTLFVAGIPSLLVGAELAGLGIGMGQLILSAPIGVVAGALLMGLLGRQAAGSGAPGAYLGRPAFGSLGGVVFSLVRLAFTLSWAALVLQIAGRWAVVALSTWNLALPLVVAMSILAVLAVAAFLPGPLWSARALLRKRVFAIAIIVLLVAAWRILSNADASAQGTAEGSFMVAFDAVLGLAILWSTIGSDIAGFAHRDEEAATGLGFGFAIASLLFVLAGAAFSSRLGGMDSDLTLLGTGTLGAILALLWVPLMEVDGLGGLTASSAWSAETLLPGIPPRVLMVLAGGGALTGALMLEFDVLRSIGDLALSVVTPAVGVILVDAFLVRGGSYSADELYRWRGDYGLFNLIGLGSWVAGAAVTVWLRPKSAAIREWLPTWPGDGPVGLPGILIGLLTAALLYFVVGKLIYDKSARRYHMRRV